MNRFLNSFRVAFNGIRLASSGRNFRVQTGVALLVAAMGIWLEITRVEWLFIFTLVGLVLSLEIVNTALERFVDWKGREASPQAGDIKDMAAGAVLWASILSAAAGLIIFAPRIAQLLE